MVLPIVSVIKLSPIIVLYNKLPYIVKIFMDKDNEASAKLGYLFIARDER